MRKVKQAVDTFLSGYNCSQAIAKTYGPNYGLSPLVCSQMSCGFGAGMRRAEVCGAVTGALMILGLHYGPKDDTDTTKEQAYSKVSDFNQRFEGQCGSILCRDLLACDISTPDGMNQASEQGLFKSICPEMVKKAAEILEDMIGSTKGDTPK